MTHVWELPSLAQDGIGGGAIGVPVIGIVGGCALSGRGSRVGRRIAGTMFLAGLVVWALTATSLSGISFGLGTARGLWATTLYDGLLITLALAVSIPFRAPATPAPAGRPVAVGTQPYGVAAASHA